MDERAVLALESIAKSLKSIDHRVGRVGEELDEIETSISQAYRHWMEHYAPSSRATTEAVEMKKIYNGSRSGDIA